MILPPFAKGVSPSTETFLLRVQFGPIWSRDESKRNLKLEDRGSKLLPLYRWTNYITLVMILFEILLRVRSLRIFFVLPSCFVARIFWKRFVFVSSRSRNAFWVDTRHFSFSRFDRRNIHLRRWIIRVCFWKR